MTLSALPETQAKLNQRLTKYASMNIRPGKAQTSQKLLWFQACLLVLFRSFENA